MDDRHAQTMSQSSRSPLPAERDDAGGKRTFLVQPRPDSPPRTLRRLVINLGCLTVPSALLGLTIFELVFRTVIPACELPHAYFDADRAVLRYDTSGPRTGLFTAGPLARPRSRWRINNHGWNSPLDYSRPEHRAKPMIAVIGDSYVEAFHVDVQNGVATELQELVGDDWEVYGFGMSGAPLSQYLQMARYVRQDFRPTVLVFVVVHNDFAESLRQFETEPHFLQLAEVNGGFEEVPPVPYQPSRMRRALGRSALVRYVWFNLQAQNAWQQRTEAGRRFNANIDVERVSRYRSLVRKATLHLIAQIRRENPESSLVFVIDAPRRDIYSGTAHRSSVIWLHEVLQEACGKTGSVFIDLTPSFLKAFDRSGVRFNSEQDFHWNRVGHRLAAETLSRELKARGVLVATSAVGGAETPDHAKGW